MKVTECLNTEHGVFLTQLRMLENMLQNKAPLDAIRAVTLTIASAVENHRQMEERLLYPAIVREYGEGFPPIMVMESEHKTIEECITGIATKSPDTLQLVRNFITVLRQHIMKEIDVLFPMAEQKISVEELEAMANQCAEHSRAAEESGTGHGGCCASCQ